MSLRDHLDEWTSTDAHRLREHLATLRERVRYLLDEFSECYGGLAENYTLIVLLYWRVFDGLEVPDSWLQRASVFDSQIAGITNPWSIGRVFALEKRDYQTQTSRARSRELEEQWRFLMRGGTVIDESWLGDLK